MLSFADNFLAGSVLTLVMPTALLIAIAVWYVVAVRHIPSDTPESSSVLPTADMVAAAGDAVDELNPTDPPPHGG